MSIETLLLGVALIACLALAAAALTLAWRVTRQTSDTAHGLETVSAQVAELGHAVHARLDGNAGEMSRTLAQALQQTTQALTGGMSRVREETRAKLDEKFVEVTARLGDLKAANDRIVEFSRSLDQFQRMLQSPKLRGDFGEFALEQMLADLLPSASFDCQAPVGGSRVDAVIRTPQGAICIDSKFPLDNFRRALDSPEGSARDAAMRAFASDVRGRVDEIATRYIMPPDTLDLALMFVPAENVYYELLGRPDLLEYARSRRVVPVSPNTLYAYFQALAMGFRGLVIQREARQVERMLDELRARFDRFHDHFQKVGKHLDNAQTQFEAALRDVERFQRSLADLKIGRVEPVEPLEPADLFEVRPSASGVARSF
jgi:DNA recombination protein RmuC